jgi:hypothetical protein
VCALVIFIGAFSNSWVTAGRGMGIGPTGVEICFGQVCKTHGWRGVAGDIQVFGTLSLIGGIVAAAACVAFGGLFLANKRDKLPAVKIANGAFGFAIAAMAVFEMRLVTSNSDMTIGWSVFPALAGLIMAGVMLRKLAPHLQRPSEIGATPMPMTVSPTLPSGPYVDPKPPSCPRCGTPLTFVQGQQRWFCVREQDYV